MLLSLLWELLTLLIFTFLFFLIRIGVVLGGLLLGDVDDLEVGGLVFFVECVSRLLGCDLFLLSLLVSQDSFFSLVNSGLKLSVLIMLSLLAAKDVEPSCLFSLRHFCLINLNVLGVFRLLRGQQSGRLWRR